MLLKAQILRILYPDLKGLCALRGQKGNQRARCNYTITSGLHVFMKEEELGPTYLPLDIIYGSGFWPVCQPISNMQIYGQAKPAWR